jgi:hypothetical protein
MRRNTVQRDEIRFNGSSITTMPANSVLENEWGKFEPIPPAVETAAAFTQSSSKTGLGQECWDA